MLILERKSNSNQMTQTQDTSSFESLSFKTALLFWWKLGWISFGGPAGQIAIMHEELVERRRWISEGRFLHALNYCMVLPGPEAQQLATYIGWLMHGTRGGIAAGVLFVLPSLFLMIFLSWLYIAFGNLPIVAALFYGIKAAVTAIVLHALHRIASRSLKNLSLWSIALASFLAIFVFNLPFPLIVALAALCGYLGARYLPQHFKQAASHATKNHSTSPALFDDDTSLPAHAKFTYFKCSQVVLCGLVLWCVPMLALWSYFGWQHSYTQMAWFFTKAALLTFGGAYAVLPYVMQGAVHHYAWLTPTQMIDGLALGETTPGPLIMVLAFVGFIGAYVQALFGPEQLFLAGAFAAVLVTWFTFLPSFVFILAGAPFIESTHKNLNFTAPLNAITAAVVGVIFNLALFFAYHVIWPNGWQAQFDYVALILTLCASVALFKFKIKVMHVIAASALLGLFIKMI